MGEIDRCNNTCYSSTVEKNLYSPFKPIQIKNTNLESSPQNDEFNKENNENKNNKKKNILKIAIPAVLTVIAGLIALFKKPGAANFEPNIVFKKAQTMQEAIEYAKKHFNISEFDFGEDLEFANWVNEGLTNINNRFKGKAHMPKALSFMAKEQSTSTLHGNGQVGGVFYPYGDRIEFSKLVFDKNNILKEFLDLADLIYQKNDKGVSVKLLTPFVDMKSATEIGKYWEKIKENPDQFSRFELHYILSMFKETWIGITAPDLCLKKVAKNKDLLAILKKANYDFDLNKALKLDEAGQKNILEEIGNIYSKETGKNVIPGISAQQGTISTFDILYHEMGHKLHHATTNLFDNIFGVLGKKSQKAFLQGEDFNIAKNISNYAQESPEEFVAEVFKGLVCGEKYSDEIMEIYKKYKGPMIFTD